MSEALVRAESLPDYLPIPKGTSTQQFRLAKALLTPGSDEKTRTELMLAAGYTLVTAQAGAARALSSVGTQRAIAAIQAAQADSARGLDALANRALTLGENGLKDLDTRELLTFGLNAKVKAAELGENVSPQGYASGWKQRIRRAMRLAYRLGYLAGRMGRWGLRDPIP